MDAISDVSRASQIKSSVPIRSPLPDPLDVEKLLGFSDETKRNSLEEGITDLRYFDRNKIFINQIDSFTGKYLVSVLSRKQLEINEDDKEFGKENVIINDEPKDASIHEHIKPNKKGKTASVSDLKTKGKQGSPAKSKETSGKIKSDKKKPLSSPKESNLPLLENSVDLRYSVFDEKIAYDTSKLTVAEYFEMMELEDGEPREEYLKEKLDEFKVVIPPLHQQRTKPSRPNSIKEIKISDFEIIGTITNKEFSGDFVQEGVTEIISSSHENLSFIKHIAKCGVIIYNILDDSEQAVEASWVLNSLSHFIQELKEDGEMSEFPPPLFILLSTFMTWSLSKSLHPKIPDLPFSEKDYRKRTPHPNYQMHYELEEQVIRVKAGGEIDAIILTCGIPYGHEESVFSYFFETAVNCNMEVPVYYGSSQNFFPVIHVENIGEIVREVIKKSDKITLPFLFAKDPISFYKKDVIKAITRGFGAECYKIMPEEFSFLEDAITQDIYDQTMANIYMESCCPLFQEEDIKWKYINGFVEDMKYIVKEFIDAKNLKPLNIVVFGSSLKDMQNLPQRLSQYYHCLYLNPDFAVQDYVSGMLEKITKFEEQKHTENTTQQRVSLKSEENHVNVPNLKIEVTEEHCEDYNFENSLEFFRKLNIKHIEDISKLTKMQMVSILHERMKSRMCLIHGYVLDDFPKSLAEAQSLFSIDDRYTFQNDDFSEHPHLPDYVVYLNQVEEGFPELAVTGDDAYQYSKEEPSFMPDDTMKVLPQENMQTVNKTKIENTMENRMDGKNNEVNAPEAAVIDFFLEKNKNCKLIKLDINGFDNPDRAFNEVIESIIQIGAVDTRTQEMTDNGRSCQEANILQGDEQNSNAKVECQAETVMENVETETITNTQEGRSSKLKNAEEMKIAINSCPYISYLISYVYPTLTNALLAVTEQRPEDPLDFLAEYLFKNNPDGKMMDPTRAKIEEEMRNRDLGFPNIDSKACLS
uniref:Uncharacterized protein n=1 Tax=Cuerna arida TaxID=1464854 RepID=A0A1B6GYM4_9HEMI